MSQLVVVFQVLLAQRYAEHAQANQGADLMFDQLGAASGPQQGHSNSVGLHSVGIGEPRPASAKVLFQKNFRRCGTPMHLLSRRRSCTR